MKWNIDSERPVYIQLIEQIQAGIISGLFRPGDRLPSVRDLAAEAGVNPNTMQRALSELERTHLVYSQRTSGRFITSDLEMIQRLKRQLAQDLMVDFLERMRQMGFESNETLAMMEKTIKEMKE